MLAAWGAWLGVHDVQLLVAVALLLFARLLPLSVLSPWLTSAGSGWLLLLSVCAMLSVVLLPHALVQAPPHLPSGVAFVVLFARELLVGAGFAFLVRLPLEAMTMAGQLSDRVGGEPAASGMEGPLTALYRWFGVVLFVVCGGAELSLRMVADGLAAMPLGQPLAWSDLHETTLSFVGLCSSAVGLSLLLAMPVLLGGLLVDVAQALTQRWLAPWPSTWLWLPTRQLVAIALAMASLSFVASALPDAYMASLAQAQALLDRLTP